ncbi:hypothetical protein [Paractinoplanes brasiliensis]|uniref:hypothetical protein n=1 Tax=Paractinoplanes brasiliensis TaxID=52695 RepID=UPI001EF22703|nr:hypothetical protein [Actinoplanes brasiliensis]
MDVGILKPRDEQTPTQVDNLSPRPDQLPQLGAAHGQNPPILDRQPRGTLVSAIAAPARPPGGAEKLAPALLAPALPAPALPAPALPAPALPAPALPAPALPV